MVWNGETVWEMHQDEYVSVVTTASKNETIYSPVDDSPVATIARTTYSDRL